MNALGKHLQSTRHTVELIEIVKPRTFSLLSILYAVAFLLSWINGQLISTTKKESRTVLALGAANGWTNWSAIESHGTRGWSLHYADLEGFGDRMKQKNFQAAVDFFAPRLQLAIKLLKPSVVLVASKGLNVLTHLATQGIHQGPAVLLSPIPNECHSIRGETWEEQWYHSLRALADNTVGPIGIGVGNSADEQSLIVELMNETQACGILMTSVDGLVHFERCPKFFLRSYPGNHGWKNDPANAVYIASLIDEVMEKAEHDTNDKAAITVLANPKEENDYYKLARAS
jgi:hypothetical protein